MQMQEENKNITLKLGTVSLEEELGSYYIDMRPAIIHYNGEYYAGKFDENGVPMIGLEDEFIYSPVNICQYGFMLHANYMENPSSKTLQQLKNLLNKLDELKTESADKAVWWSTHFDKKYHIQPPHASAMTQGECISFYLRMYQILNDTSLLETAIKSYNFLDVAYSEKGVKRIDQDGNLWYEEFPSDPPSYVLNGFIYTLFGLYDLYRVTKRVDVKEKIDQCIKTLNSNLAKFDAGYWSYYDLLKKELVRYYYQKNVHVPQLRVLHIMTKDTIFKKYADKWERQLKPWNYLFVKIMYRILPRWRNKNLSLK